MRVNLLSVIVAIIFSFYMPALFAIEYVSGGDVVAQKQATQKNQAQETIEKELLFARGLVGKTLWYVPCLDAKNRLFFYPNPPTGKLLNYELAEHSNELIPDNIKFYLTTDVAIEVVDFVPTVNEEDLRQNPISPMGYFKLRFPDGREVYNLFRRPEHDINGRWLASYLFKMYGYDDFILKTSGHCDEQEKTRCEYLYQEPPDEAWAKEEKLIEERSRLDTTAPEIDPKWDWVTQAVWRTFRDAPDMIDSCAVKLAHEVDMDDPHNDWPGYCDNFERTAVVVERVAELKKLIKSLRISKRNLMRLSKGTIWVGAPESFAILSWGRPKHVNRTITTGVKHEQWVYQGGYIYIENGKVVAIQN